MIISGSCAHGIVTRLSSLLAVQYDCHLLEDAEVFVSVDEVERRLFQVVVDHTREIAKQVLVGGGRRNHEEALGSSDRFA